MVRTTLHLSLIAFSLGMSFAAQSQGTVQGQSEAMARLAASTFNGAEVSINQATGTARFVRVAPGGNLLGPQTRLRAASEVAKHSDSLQFLSNYGGLFGITNAATELDAARVATDQMGGTHITYKQVYQGLPVFGAQLKTHFDPANNLAVVSGTFVPGIEVDPAPTRSAEQASATAIAVVSADLGMSTALNAYSPTLMIYREGLAAGVAGANHLVWQVEVGNRADVREFVYVDAHSGKVVDQITGIYDAKNRRAFDGAGAAQPGPNYPNNPYWVEGNSFPTANTEANNMILASSDVYDFYKKAFGRDSFDGNGATMDAIFNRGNDCPNASWNGVYISFCPGLTSDDVTAHEWSHAYTQYTDNLIYAWQPGALNESYSDIWGETVDRINGRGGDTPDVTRSTGACTVFTPNLPTITITAPPAIAGPKATGTAAFGPQTFSVSGNVVQVNDGVGTAIDGCETPFVNAAAVAGNIAFIDRGVCGFAVKVKNAQLNGAIAVIIGNNQGGNAVLNMAGVDATIVIPALSVTQNDGTAIKAQSGVTASLVRGGVGTDNSVRWLLGEDDTAPGLTGALRDMWNPPCYGNPGKVSDVQYACSSADSGGVHNNSGVPNHGYALLVDGGSYNGQSIAGIGLTKAAHIYYRAQSVYQGPSSDFPAHADALQQSCTDLIGINLNGLTTGVASGEIINAADCAQVAKVALAVEFRTPANQCNFQPLLAKSPPPLCTAGTAASIFADSFDGGKRGGARWLLTHTNTADVAPLDWGVVNGLPNGRPGYAIFAADADVGTCSAGGDATRLQRLESPAFTIPAGATAPRLTFDHWVATESGWDGGNVKISVNGGAWQVVAAGNFIYNPYNTTLNTAAGGNTNPLAGQPAFSGTDAGSVSGSWGRSIVNLGPYAVAGDSVKLRFELGNDGCGGSFGWYLDDVMVYQCAP